jgi:hypothetical protein
VIERGTYTGNDGKVHPTARILTADNIEWGVIAFHGWLHSAFERKDPRVGDFVAIAYTGTKPAKRKGDNDAFTYALEVERNPDVPSTASHEDYVETLVEQDIEAELEAEDDHGTIPL